jgi:hypothetical protein
MGKAHMLATGKEGGVVRKSRLQEESIFGCMRHWHMGRLGQAGEAVAYNGRDG